MYKRIIKLLSETEDRRSKSPKRRQFDAEKANERPRVNLGRRKGETPTTKDSAITNLSKFRLSPKPRRKRRDHPGQTKFNGMESTYNRLLDLMVEVRGSNTPSGVRSVPAVVRAEIKRKKEEAKAKAAKEKTVRKDEGVLSNKSLNLLTEIGRGPMHGGNTNADENYWNQKKADDAAKKTKAAEPKQTILGRIKGGLEKVKARVVAKKAKFDANREAKSEKRVQTRKKIANATPVEKLKNDPQSKY